jgi:peptidoglycan/xylan/chitin deacetylase (PgdA/CDA1 family)
MNRSQNYLTMGNIGKSVKELQRTLQELFFPIRADGCFGIETFHSVRVIQAARGVFPSGVVDENTYRAIAAAGKSISLQAPRHLSAAPRSCSVISSTAHKEKVPRGLYEWDKIQNTIALTFDDGPDSICTPQILDVLNRSGQTATFYAIGVAAQEQPTLLARIAQRHTLGNHSWNHPIFTRCRDDEVVNQISTTRALLRELTDSEVAIFRPPYGIPFFTQRPPYGALWSRYGKLFEDAQVEVVMWHIDSADWSFVGRPDLVVSRVREQLDNEGGGVVLMHDVHWQTVFALPGVLDLARQRGLRICADRDLLDQKYE